MPNNIDEHVVKMSFDNKQFESGVSQSLKTLDDLKKALNFDEVEGSLKNIENAFNNLDLSGLADSVDFIASRFEPLGKIADVALSRIADKALDAGKKITDAFFGFSDMSAGQSKYETRTKAVQTIMNATGKSIEEVEAVLDSLQTYTDETSYDFAAMVDNIGKFTSVGVDLEMAEKAMEGIGNEAAKSGASIQQANNAMYNFAQALSQGAVKLQDWRSISNATMATKEFKEMLISTAIEIGTLESAGENVGSLVSTNEKQLAAGEKALAKAQKATKDRAEKVAAAQEKIASATKKTEVNFQNFESTLSDGWLTADVLIKTLNKYSNMNTDFGREAYYAAQKALTFTDAIQATKDAVSSGWMDSFGYIFGNLEEAMELWTNVANALYEYVAIFADWRNEVLESWHTMGGYNDMIEAASNLWQTFMNIVKGVGEALTNVFPILNPENMSQALRDGTKALKDWSAGLLEMFGLQEDVKKEEEEAAEEAEEVADKVDSVKESADSAADSMTDLSDASKEVAKNVNGIETGIKRGMRGDNVKALQQKLVSLGFRLDKFGVDGIFGPETQGAVEELQRALGVEVTGALDEATIAALNTEEGMAKLQERMHKGLSSGDVGKDVKDIQNELNKYLGSNDKIVADGIYGPKTKAAVEKLQKELGIEVTGVWDDTTRAAFESSKMVLFSLDKIRKGIKRGDTSKEVKALQEQLIKTGYLTDQSVADGVYGPKTEEAVKKLQRELGVEETGVWDEATYHAVAISKRMKKANLDTAKSAEEAAETVDETSEKTEESAESADKATTHTTVAMMRLQNIVKGWAAAFKIATKFASAVTEIAGNILGMFSPLVDVAIRFGSVFGGMFENLAKTLDENDTYGSFVKNVTDAFKPFGDFIKSVANGLNRFLDAYDAFLESTGKRNTFGNFFDFLNDYLKKIPAIGFIIDIFETVKSTVGPIISFLIEQVKSLIGWFGSDGFKQAKDSVFGWISEKLTVLREAITKFREDHPELTIENFLNKIKEIGGWVGGKFGEGIDTIKNKFAEFKAVVDQFAQDHPELSISNIFEKIKDTFKGIGDMFSKFFSGGDQSEGGSFFDALKERFKAFEPVLDWMEGIKDRIVKLWQSIFGGGEDVTAESGITKTVKAQITTFDGLQSKMSGIQSVVDWFVNLKDRLINAWNDLTNVGKTGGPDLVKEGGFTSVFDRLGEFSKEIAKIDLGKVISTALKAMAVYSVLNISNGIKNFGKGAKTFGKDIGKMVESLTKPFTAIANKVAQNFDFKGLSKALSERVKYGKQEKESIGTKALKLAGSLLMVVAAIAIVTKVVKDNNQNDMDKALWIVGGILLALGTISILVAAFSKEKATNSKGSMTGILALCGGIYLVVLAIGRVIGIITGTTTQQVLDKALWIVGGALVILGVISVLIAAFSKGETSGVKGILSLCAGVYILVLALEKTIKIIKDVSDTELNNALVIVGGMLVLLGIFAVLISATSNGKTSEIKGLLKMCLGVYVLVLALEKVISIVDNATSSSLDKALWILGGMTVALGIISVLVAALSKHEKVKISGIKSFVLGLSAMVGLLSVLIHIVDTSTQKSLDKALWILGGMVVAVAAFLLGSYFIGSGDSEKRSKAMLKGAGTIVGALGIIVGAATILVGGLGELARIESLDLIGSMKRGKEILTIVAESFASFKDKLGANWLVIAGFLAASWLVGYFPTAPTSMIEGAAAISATLAIIVSAATVLIGGIGELDRIESLDLLGSVKRGKEILAIVASTLSSFKEKMGLSLPTIGGILTVSTMVGLIPTAPTSMIEGATAISAALAIIVSAATILITGIGAIDENIDTDLVKATESGGKILESVATTLSSFGEKLKLNLPIIAGMLVASIITGLIPGGKLAMIAGASAIGLAADALIVVVGTLITGLGVLNQWTDNGLSQAIDSGGAVLESISGAIARVKSGFTKVYNEDLKDFGEAMESVREGIEGINADGTLDSDMTAATSMASKLYSFFNSLSTYSLVDAPNVIDGYTSVASILIDDVDAFGKAINNLWNGVSGISKDKDINNDVDTSIQVVTKLKTDFFDVIGNEENIPDGSGLQTYNGKIDEILGNVKTFGENIGIFHNNVTGFSSSQIESDATTAINIATHIANFLEFLTGMNIEQKSQGIKAWFSDETKGETVIDTVGELAEAMTNSASSFSGLANAGIEKDVTAAISSLKAVAEFLTYVSNDANMDSASIDPEDSGWIGKDKLQKLLGGLSRIAQELVAFDNQTKDLPLDDIAAVSRMISDFLQFGLAGADFNADSILSGINFEDVNSRIAEIIGYVQTAISQNESDLTKSGSSLASSLYDALNEKTSDFNTAGENFVRGLTNGVYFQTRFAVEAAAYVARQMVTAVKNTFQTASPSKVTTQIGKYFSEGLSNGVREEGDNAVNSSQRVAENMMQATKDSLLPLSTALFDDIDDNPVIRPVVDMSNVEAAKNRLPGYFSGQSGRLSVSASLAKNVAGEFERQRSSGKNGFKNSGSLPTISRDSSDPERYILNNSDGAGLLDRFDAKFEKLANAITNMQVVLDTGEFVGATSGAYDKQFGKMAGRKGRGN